jgi:hypothetical protein
MRKSNKNHGIKCLVKDTLYNPLSQAIIKLIETPYSTLKAFLFICILISISLCAYLIIELVLSYLNFGVSTTTRTLYETSVVFPKVTICNVNPFTTRYALEFLKQINREYYPFIDIFNMEQMRQLGFGEKYKIINNFNYLAINKMNSLNETEKRKLSHSLNDLMPSCSFNMQKCSLDNDDFAWYFDPFYGNCWMFNYGVQSGVQVRSNSVPGVLYGLRVIFYVNFYESLSIINSNGGGLGALVKIENGSYLMSHQTDGYGLEPGYWTSVSVSRSFKYSLPKPYSDCLIDNKTNGGFHSELFNLIQNSAYRYTQPTCFQQCMQRVILVECNCTDSSLNSLFKNASQCLTINELGCMSRLYGEKLYKSDFVQRNCLRECPLECYFEQFDVSLSSIELIPNYYVDYLRSNANLSVDFLSNSNVDEERARKSFVSLNIFYKSLTYDLSLETPQTNSIWLLASIGGYLSLFLGLSLFSVCELLQLLFEIVLLKYF